MDDYYRVPTLLLLSLLVAVFAALYVRSRTQRRLLWLIGWVMATVRVALIAANSSGQGIGKAISQSCMILAACMFLGALSPFTIGRRTRISYAIPFAAPIVFFAVSTAIVPHPGIILHSLNFLAILAAAAIGIDWGRRKNLLPLWFKLTWALAIAAACFTLATSGDNDMVVEVAHSGINFVTALLVLAAYRRLTPGVIFTASGFLLWSSVVFLVLWAPHTDPVWSDAIQLLNLTKVITAVGMIVLVLEDEAKENENAQRRDRRARIEMERYAKLNLNIEPQRDFGIQYIDVCSAIVEAGRFEQAAIFLVGVERNLHLAASCGWDAESSAALDSLTSRLSLPDLRRCCAELSAERDPSDHFKPINLCACLASNTEAELLKLSSIYTLPITARSGDLQGILLLSGLKDEKEPLLPEDMLPLQLLVARVAAARENGLLSRRITRSEKLAGIGRLAGGVAHELNNPLTVVMGYAELISESALEEVIRREAQIIREQSQRMKQIVESLGRFWKPAPSPTMPVDIADVLAEVDGLRRSVFERSQIRFDVILSPGLPHVLANVEQIRQVLLQLLDAAASATANPGAQPEKRIRVEANRTANVVQIAISDSGPGFVDPEKVFDPFFTIKPPGEGPALALSLCYSVVREQGGDLTAINLKPHGGAIILELPVESAAEGSELAIHHVQA